MAHSSTPQPEKISDFLRTAQAEAARYGHDPMVLFRELGQNSRDAKATKITIKAYFKNGLLRLEFSDNGIGMSFEHAKAFLFRLYSSSKERDDTSAGRFGVGFWSVLLARPTWLEVHSRTNESKWGIGLKGDLTEYKTISCSKKQTGTTVVLWLEPGEDDKDSLEKFKQGAARYLCHLRTAKRKPGPLLVLFNDKSINRPFSLSGPGTLQFEDGPVEGVVGLGAHPSYSLYARGLPVAEGVYLDELRARTRRKKRPEEPDGLAPMYVVNGNRLSVVLNRNTVVFNDDMDHVIKVARRRFDELVACTIDGPRSGRNRFRHVLRSFLRKFSNIHGTYRLVLFGLLLFAFGALSGGVINNLVNRTSKSARAVKKPPKEDKVVKPQKPSPVSLPEPIIVKQSALNPEGSWKNLRTATVNPGRGTNRWTFSYSSDRPLMFRRMVLNSWDRALGWQVSAEADTWSQNACSGRKRGSFEVRIPTRERKGNFELPIPTGYMLACDSASLNGHKLESFANWSGQAMASIKESSGGVLRYRVRPMKRLRQELIQTMSGLPLESLPAALEERLEGFQDLELPLRIKLAVNAVDDLLAYDRSKQTAEEYKRRLDGNRDWLEQILAIGAGDCDVINAVLVLALRRMGIPSRLVAGIVGEGHGARDGWHAWVEVVENGKLRVEDATLNARLLPRQQAVVASSCQVQSPIHYQQIQHQPASPSQNSATVNPQNLLAVLSLAGFLFIVALYYLAPRHRSRLNLSANDSVRRRLLVEMLSDAIKRPEAWRQVEGIWHRKVLPCIGGRKISLASLVHLGHRARAFVGKRSNDLVKDALRSKAIVLDGSDKDFGPLFSRISNLRDLDSISEITPLSLPRGLMRTLVSNTQELLDDCGARLELIPVAGWKKPTAFGDMDLSPIKPGKDSKWSQSFIALNLNHTWWNEMLELYRRSPSVTLCLLADHLASNSRLLASHARKIRMKVAERELDKMT